MSAQNNVAVITIDGPSGAGKGTISRIVAKKLGYHYLDSGALYRLLGLASKRHNVKLTSVSCLATLAEHMDISFKTSESGRPYYSPRRGERHPRIAHRRDRRFGLSGRWISASSRRTAQSVRDLSLSPPAWLPMAAIWAPQYSPMPQLNSTSPPAPKNVVRGATKSC